MNTKQRAPIMPRTEIVFIDANGHRVRAEVEITDRYGWFPELTVSAQVVGHWGQSQEQIKPREGAQAELMALWDKYHLKDVSKPVNFREHVEDVLARIKTEEESREPSGATGDDAILENMAAEGIDEDRLEAVKAYMELYSTEDLRDFEESYQGEYMDDEDFAREMAEQIGAIDKKATWPNNCIDWEQAARELMYDYDEQDGFYFRNI